MKTLHFFTLTGLAAFLLLAGATGFCAAPPTPLLPIPPAVGEGPRAVPTFACLGIYWAPPGGAQDNPCEVAWRPGGSESWKEALPLWFDDRNHEYRGSIVGLKSGTGYEVRLTLEKTGTIKTLHASTWSENFPIARTVTLPASSDKTLEITEGGSANGYMLYTGSSSDCVIDVAGNSPYGVDVKASYVIVRGLTIRNAGTHGINLEGPIHDVVIEGCDISGWGRIAGDGFGKDLDAGVSGINTGLARIIVQGNRIHNPRANTNDWLQPRPQTKEKAVSHPNGPQAVVFFNPEGNNVIRYNEVFSDEQHRFNDGLGGNENFSFKGYPGTDSDVYGNIVRTTADDALEIEGGGCNVRIWGNLMEDTYTGVSTASCSLGPLYIFRNVLGRTRSNHGPVDSPENTGAFGKLGDYGGYGGGRVYYFHNTILQPPGTSPGMRSLGAGWALADWGGRMTNRVSRNNIWVITPNLEQVYLVFHGNHATNPYAIVDHLKSPTNDLDYDLLNAPIQAAAGEESHAIHGTPIYATGKAAAPYTLAPASPGYDAGVRLPNFNDDFAGAAPDMGAAEAGGKPLVFGPDAWKKP